MAAAHCIWHIIHVVGGRGVNIYLLLGVHGCVKP